MTDPVLANVGAVPSADIAVPEHERVVAFYAGALCTGERPLWREDLMNSDGQPIIGIGARTEEYAALPLQWMPHIQVADVATSVERALGAGGTELMHGKDADGKSLWAAIQDPGGAAFGVMPAAAVPAVDSATGRIELCELATSDVHGIADFYCTVVGWSIREGADGTSVVCRAAPGERPAVARIRSAEGKWGALPSTWLLHLPVGDLEESVRAVRDADGAVLLEVSGSADSTAYTVVRDPVGAVAVLRKVTAR